MYENQILFFMKFGKRVNIKKLQDGEFYANNFKYYIKLEEKTGQKGAGDKEENALVVSNAQIQMFDTKTDKLFLRGSANVTIRNPEEELIPVFCMRYIDINDLKGISLKDGIMSATLEFSTDDINYFKREFGDTVLFISPVDFLNRLTESINLQKSKTDIVTGKVKYGNYAVNYHKRIESFTKNISDKFFWKNEKYFMRQKEYRIVFPNLRVNDHFDVNIGSIKEITKLCDVDELNNKKFKIICEPIK